MPQVDVATSTYADNARHAFEAYNQGMLEAPPNPKGCRTCWPDSLPDPINQAIRQSLSVRCSRSTSHRFCLVSRRLAC